jgi:PAS domain S-box-containing protein
MKLRPVLKPILHNFSAKVFISLVSAMVILFSILTYMNNRNQIAAFEEDIQREGNILTKVTANAARLGLFAENAKMLHDAVRPTLTSAGVLAIYVMDRDRKVLVREFAPKADRQLSTCLIKMPGQEQEEQLRIIVQSPAPVFIIGKEAIEFWAPVRGAETGLSPEALYFSEPDRGETTSSNILGFVGIVMDKTPLQQGLRAIIKHNLLLLAFSFVLVAIITYFIVRAVTRPLTSLANKVKVHSSSTPPQDELGMLTITYDSLVQDLSQSFDVIHDLNAQLAGKVAALQLEIKKRQQTETALRVSEEKYRGLVETLNDIVYATDLEGKFIYISRSANKLAGYMPEELIGKNFIDYVHPHHRQFVMERFANGIRTRNITSTEAEFIRKDGSTVFLEINGGPLMGADGKMIGRIGSARDVTQRREAEHYRQELEVKALNQSKMAALGEIATGIAHEINQPLSFIKVIYESTLNDIELDQVDKAELKADFTEALHQVRRITQIINHLRTFGHSNNNRFEKISLPQVVDSTLILMGPKINKSNITLEQEIAPNLPDVFGNAINLEQVFINLIQNSLNAMEGKGEGEIYIRMLPAGDRVVIQYRDNGPGVPVEIQDRIFEPFFTTSEVGRGTGLGLAITFGIIREHNGTIEFESTPGHGITFTITLPVAREGWQITNNQGAIDNH